MDAKYLIYSEKEIENIIKYYLGNPKVYKYCYENSPEFKEYVDNASEKAKSGIQTMHKAYYASHIQEYLLHFATMGLTLLFKKLREKKEFSQLEETIQSDEFKTLFSNFDTVLINNKLRNSTK